MVRNEAIYGKLVTNVAIEDGNRMGSCEIMGYITRRMIWVCLKMRVWAQTKSLFTYVYYVSMGKIMIKHEILVRSICRPAYLLDFHFSKYKELQMFMICILYIEIHTIYYIHTCCTSHHISIFPAGFFFQKSIAAKHRCEAETQERGAEERDKDAEQT